MQTCSTPHATDTEDTPRVREQSFLTLHYRLSGPAGEVVNTFSTQAATLSLGQGALAPALEQCLLGLAEGERRVFDLPAGQVFGERDPQLLQWVTRKLLDGLGQGVVSYHLGEVVQFPAPEGSASYAGVVRELRDDGAVLFDFNHPLAGQPVRFEVQVVSVL